MTGGNSGTGYATCKALYDKGATVYMACRSKKKAVEAIEAIKRGGVFGVAGITYPATGSTERIQNGRQADGSGHESGRRENRSGCVCEKGRLEFLELDLADLYSVERCAEELRR